jgi:hypothetical protein
MNDEEIVKKWKRVLEYESKNIPKMDESKYVEVAKLMDDMELRYIKLGERYLDRQESYKNFIRMAIPMIRYNEGPLEEIEIGYETYYIVKDLRGDGGMKYAVHPLYGESIPFKKDSKEPELIEYYREEALIWAYRYKQERFQNLDHDRDYFEIWKMIKEPNETVVDAVKRVMKERDDALGELERIRDINH